jgi:hypothetical protein
VSAQSWLVSPLVRVSGPIKGLLFTLFFVDLVAGTVGLLDFDLEQFGSPSQMKLSDQRGDRTAVGEDMVEVIGAVGAQLHGFL